MCSGYPIRPSIGRPDTREKHCKHHTLSTTSHQPTSPAKPTSPATSHLTSEAHLTSDIAPHQRSPPHQRHRCSTSLAQANRAEHQPVRVPVIGGAPQQVPRVRSLGRPLCVSPGVGLPWMRRSGVHGGRTTKHVLAHDIHRRSSSSIVRVQASRSLRLNLRGWPRPFVQARPTGSHESVEPAPRPSWAGRPSARRGGRRPAPAPPRAHPPRA
jgi:hypothetical protein